MMYTKIANCNLKLASETAFGLVDKIDVNRETIPALMIVFYAVIHKYKLSVPDVLQIVEKMEQKAKEEQVPELSATIRFIQGEI